MSFNLRNRSLLTVQDYTPREFRYLLDLARDLKRAKYARTEQKHLDGKEICLIFEKTSTRTRCAFEVACYDQGAHVTYLDPSGSQIGHKESFKDTARVLGRMYDAIEYRGASQAGVEELAKYAGVPVFNGLTDEYHPTQMLADVMTMREHSDKPIHEIKYAFMGDTRNNMGHSLMIVGCLMGMDVRICGPEDAVARPTSTSPSRASCRSSPARSSRSPTTRSEAVEGVDFIHTDVWVSMGEPKEVWKERIDLLLPYQVNAELMKASGNPQVKFMHCLPAFHDTETTLGKQIAETYGLDERRRGHQRRVRVGDATSRSSRPRTACTRSRPFSSPRWETDHAGRHRARRQRAPPPRRADDRGEPARERPHRRAGARAGRGRSISWSSATATDRRSACSRCRAPRTRKMETIRSTCWARRREGMIGYMIEQELGNLLPFERPFATLLTMIEVDPDDPAFENPTKFIGPVYAKDEADRLAAEKGWVFKPDGDKWRRVVAVARAEAHLRAAADQVAARAQHDRHRRRRRRHPDDVRAGRGPHARPASSA